MKKSELVRLIKEIQNNILLESAPEKHSIDKNNIILYFNSEEEATLALNMYGSLYARYMPDRKSIYLPVDAVIRFLVNTFQNRKYNFSMPKQQ